MPPVLSGVWKNTEDEILKAAISKYGKNQWNRIASLLAGKSAKQCKARWTEWLDPAIKKTDWSREEDEKLLYLAKIMPSQWRTIAPIVGRTANQCIERFQQLIDDADRIERRDLGLGGVSDDAGPSADDVRRLRPGEVDPTPETRPARPDAIDMDEAEKEMLSEARARFANTQGKKAKRKAREKHLEEAKRLAGLQKRREAKAAGVTYHEPPRRSKKKDRMDYMADIPFEKQPELGPYDVTDENDKEASRVDRADKEFDANTGLVRDKPREFWDLVRKRPAQDGASQTNKKAKEERSHEQSVADKAKALFDSQILQQKQREKEEIARRMPLDLPQPQVGDEEMQTVAKLGEASSLAREMAQDGLPTDLLLGMSQREAHDEKPSASADSLLLETRNVRSLTNQQTPLLGEASTALWNPVPIPQPGPPDDDAVSRTAASMTSMSSRYSVYAESLRAAFHTLPEARKDYDIDLPEQEEEPPKADTLEMDAAQRDRILEKARAHAFQDAMNRRSLAVKKSLPRPAEVPPAYSSVPISSVSEATQALLASETAKIVAQDAALFPPGAPSDVAPSMSTLTDAPTLPTESARALVDAELERMPPLNPDSVSLDLWERPLKDLTYDPERQMPVLGAAVGDAGRIAGSQHMLEQHRASMTKLAAKAAKLETKVHTMLAGFLGKSDTLSSSMADVSVSLDDIRAQISVLSLVQADAQRDAHAYCADVDSNLALLAERGAHDQAVYEELLSKRDALQRDVDDLLYDEAELVNEMA